VRILVAAMLGLLLFLDGAPAGGQEPGHTPARRIIDVHMHVYATDPRWERRAPNPVTGVPLTATTEDAHRRATLEQMRKHGVVLAVISNGTPPADVVRRWVAAAPERFVPAIGFDAPGAVTPEWIRSEHGAGRLRVIGEIGAPYAGYSAGDSAYEPYFALAEELDIPIAVHAGTPGGGATYGDHPKYRMEFNRPLRLEEMLVRHPRARVQLMHAGWPFTDETVALLKGHPQVYVDIAVINWVTRAVPRAEFYAYLRRLMDAGLGERIMFGSDQMAWPEAIGMAVETVEGATFLSEEQKQNIFCRNAARFLRLNPNPCGS
jgi:predicted TIM-barrel fold metal-dependent hydrolase